jgi:hypothetical protein
LEKESVAKKSKKKRLRKKEMKVSTGKREDSSLNQRDRVVRVSKDFQPDYSYVIKDLKRIGILAGSFVAILIVLSFFLR